MARIVMADDGIRFDGRTPETGPIGGAESAFIGLAEALAARGHEVTACNNCAREVEHKGVRWRPLGGGLPGAADMYIANRGDRLIPLIQKARRRVFWIHNPAGYLLKWRYLWKLWRWKPAIVFSGAYHAGTYPPWAPSGERKVIPYGIDELFRAAVPAGSPPGPRAVFTSNPLRSLDWLLDLWAGAIHPRAPEAELHVFSGAGTYGEAGAAKAARMNPVLEKAAALSDKGVVLRDPVSKPALAEELKKSRVILYRGDPGETFCLAVGESQALGVPAVVQEIGCVGERVIDGKTGYVARDDKAFARAALSLLSDDGLWLSQHRASLDNQRHWGWDEAAAAFEGLLP